MKILVAGGGSGGHIIPNIALLDELKREVKDLEVLYVGSRTGMEAEMIPKQGWDFRGISCGKLRRYFSWENFTDAFRMVAGVAQSLGIIGKFKPDVIFCKGGYVSTPVALAGGLLGEKVVIHESDLRMGMANRIASKMASTICVSFPETVKMMHGDKRVVLTGNPVRKELKEGIAAKGYAYSGLRKGKEVILVMGGSQGAEFINKMIWRNLKELTKHFQIVHACGKGKLPNEKAVEGYFACEYLGEELKDIYAITDIMISRAGANSLAEIEFLGIPAVLVPLVRGSRGDQVENAESFAKHHPAVVIDESDGEKVDLMEALDNLKKKATGRGKTSNDAAAKIAKILIETAGKKHAKKI